MKNILTEIKIIFKETGSTTFVLLKIMIPVSIIVKILAEFGIIEIIGNYLSPAMNVVGLPGDFGLVWATAMLTNIYGGLVVFFNLSIINTYTVAQVTVLSVLILLAHNLLVEIRITQKAGVRLWFMLFIRIFGAFILAMILNLIFSYLNILQGTNITLWKPGFQNPSLAYWILGELKNYLMIFIIILGLITLIRILKLSGVLYKINNFFKPGLEKIGMSKDSAPMTIIGITLGLAYGGGLIINEAKSGLLKKKDVFLSLSFMGLSHSLIEDTLLMIAIGASIIGVLFARILFTILVMIILIKIIKHLSKTIFNKYFVS